MSSPAVVGPPAWTRSGMTWAIARREVEARLVASLGHAHLDPDTSVLDAVIVEKVLAFPRAIRQRAQRRAHLLFGLVVQPVEAGEDSLRAVAREDLVETPGGHVVRGELGEDVPFPLVAPAQVGEHEIESGPLGPRGREEPDGGDPEPFLVALGGPGDIAAGDGAADIRPVGEVDGEGDESPPEEDGSHRLDVGQVVAPDFRKVEEPDVAFT